MKKKIFIFFLLLLSFFKTNAFLSKLDWDNLYLDIDKWYSNFENNMFEEELKWQSNVWENFRNYIIDENISNCINTNISQDTLIRASNWDLKSIDKIIKEECKKNWNKVKMIDFIQSKAKNFVDEKKTKSEDIAKDIVDLAKLWTYTDWNKNNSPFDLIVDLQEIDKIIFWEKLEYNWEENNNFLDLLDKNNKNKTKDTTKNKKNNNSYNSSSNKQNNNQNNSNNSSTSSNNNQNTNSTDSIDNTNNSQNDLSCFTNNSWLNTNQIKEIINNSKNDLWNRNWENSHIPLPDTNKIWFWNNINWNYIKPWKFWLKDLGLLWNYKIINDNSFWNCSPDDFFCITIDFITSKHNLLGYWENKSIKNILEVSNWHLRKANNTSLLQAKMWINNFENILRDLDFPSMFHMWMYISFKSPPLMKIDTKKKEEKQNSWKKVEELLKELYKNLWLDYNRRNDLNIFSKKEERMYTIRNTIDLNNSLAWEKINETKNIYKNYYNQELSKTEKKNILDIQENKDFYHEFVEYNKFIKWLEKYTVNALDPSVRKMKDIPTYSP